MEQTHNDTCLYCNGPLPLRKPKTRGIVKFCCKRHRERYWTEHNREKHRAAVKKNRRLRYERNGNCSDTYPKAKAQKEWMNELKSKPCHDCAGSFPVCCMDFDHREGTVKSYNVGNMFARHYSRELIQVEIDKCDLVCANCHRVRTRERRIGIGLRRISEDGAVGEGNCGD